MWGSMKITTLKSFVLTFAIFFFASTVFCQTVQPSGWQTINAENLFTFRLPKGFTKTKLTGVENYLGEYRKGEIKFLFIHKDTASNAYDVRRKPEMENYQETETKIGDRRANIRTFAQMREKERIYHAEMNIGDWENADVELYMEVESKNLADIEMAKQIFNSVVFSK